MDERSIAEIYKTIIDQNSQQLLKLGRMEGQMETLLVEARKTNGRVTDTERRVNESEKEISALSDTVVRVTNLETKVDKLTAWYWKVTGGGIALVAVYEFLKFKNKI